MLIKGRFRKHTGGGGGGLPHYVYSNNNYCDMEEMHGIVYYSV